MTQPPEPTPAADPASARREVELFQSRFQAVRDQVHRLIVGQDEVVDTVLIALFGHGHVLLEGVPGTGKTMLVKTLGAALHLDMGRVQFTPDLMPADILGNMVLAEDAGGRREIRYQQGPIHTNLLLADEINRATPKTQSALLEGMQERQVTVAGTSRPLPDPFMVLATQNPIEQEGTYPLPEAQLDRFLFKVVVGYPAEHEYAAILDRTTGSATPRIETVLEGDELRRMIDLVREVPVPSHARDTAVRLVMATQPKSPHSTERVDRYVQLGASPRGAQALVLAGKVRALIDGRFAVAAEDVLAMALPALRHRVLPAYTAIADGVAVDDLLLEIVERQG